MRSVLLAGKSGLPYRLVLVEKDDHVQGEYSEGWEEGGETKLPEVPGIYVFLKQIRSKIGYKWFPIYIGRTKNLNDRVYKDFSSHHKKDCIEDHGATHIGVYIDNMNIKSNRKTAEKDLIEEYCPPCNDQNV